MTGLSALGAATGGLWTRSQALEHASAGVVRGHVQRSWRVVWPGVLADAGYDLTAEQRCWAAVLASGGDRHLVGSGRPRAVASGRTAARYWGLPLVDDDDPATGGREHLLDEVTVWAHLPTLRHEDRRLDRHRRRLSPRDVHRTQAGLLVTTPLRTVLDLCAVLTRDAAVAAMDAALHRALVGAGDLTQAVQQRQGRPGAVALREAVTASDHRAESPIETLTRLLLRPALPTLQPQVELFDERGRLVARFDLADEQRRLAVESDGKAAHSGEVMVAKDRARDRRTEQLGWWTERVTWYEVRRRRQQTVRRIVDRARLLDERRSSGR